MTVRQLQAGAGLDEASRLFDAYRQFYGHASDPSAARMYLAMRLQAGQSAVFVAELDGRAVGFMQLYPAFCSLALAPIWILNDLYVSPEARRQGLAAQLLRAARDFGRQHGAAYLMLSTAHDNLRAQALYEAEGWQHDTVFRSYTLLLDPAG